MRTLFALGVVTLGLAAAGSAMASDDGDSKHQGRAHHESRASRERSSVRRIKPSVTASVVIVRIMLQTATKTSVTDVMARASAATATALKARVDCGRRAKAPARLLALFYFTAPVLRRLFLPRGPRTFCRRQRRERRTSWMVQRPCIRPCRGFRGLPRGWHPVRRLP